MAMSDLFEKRVEAFVRTYQRTGAFDEALLAADAVVTEEMIAETILKALVFTNENSKPWADGLARDIAALSRGGAK